MAVINLSRDTFEDEVNAVQSQLKFDRLTAERHVRSRRQLVERLELDGQIKRHAQIRELSSKWATL